jgi:hypothetical protein
MLATEVLKAVWPDIGHQVVRSNNQASREPGGVREDGLCVTRGGGGTDEGVAGLVLERSGRGMVLGIGEA